jgi:hypothetical protein
MEPQPPPELAAEHADGSSSRGRTQRYPAVPPSVAQRLWSAAREAWRQAAHPHAPPPSTDARARFFYGLQQPLLGLRVLLRNQALLGAAMAPVVFLALVCGIAAATSLEVRDAEGQQWWSLGFASVESSVFFVLAFFTTFAALAPVPPFLFARHYARMAAAARDDLGLGPRKPYLKSWQQALGETVAQVIVITLGLLPITLLLALFGFYGAVVGFIAQLGWTMYWMVVEAFDNGRTLAPDEDLESVARAEAAISFTPWFVAAVGRVEHPRARSLLAPVRGFLEVMQTLIQGWTPELRLVEQERALASGFAIGTFVLVAVPGLNLLFRPALVIAAAHLRGQLELEAARAHGEASQPSAAVVPDSPLAR